MSRVWTRNYRNLTRLFRWVQQNHTIIGSVVLDEAHTILTSQGFRPIMNRISLIMECKVPITFLTGTLPTKLYESLRLKCGLPHHTLIRAPSDRKEHQYSLFQSPEAFLVGKTAGFVMELTGLLTGTQRGVIFTPRVETGKLLEGLLTNVKLIHGDMDKNTSAREEIIREWKLGRSGGWLIGTSSLIQGVDYPDVHLVVFMGRPWGMVDFVQGAGRSGRNGTQSQVIMINTEWAPDPKGEDDGCSAELSALAENSAVCRRLGISKCMDDGQATCASLDGAAQCDICHPDKELKDMFLNCKTLKKDQAIHFPPLPPPPNSSSTRPLARLELPSLCPKSAQSTVIMNSNRMAAIRTAKVDMTKLCLLKLQTFGLKQCIVCFFHKKEQDGKKHSMCLNTLGVHEITGLYSWNKPISDKHGDVLPFPIHNTRQPIDLLRTERLGVQ